MSVVIMCDRCGKTMGRFDDGGSTFRYNNVRYNTGHQFEPSSCESIDLCPECHREFMRFIDGCGDSPRDAVEIPC